MPENHGPKALSQPHEGPGRKPEGEDNLQGRMDGVVSGPYLRKNWQTRQR
jgi:hypothetical protein